MSTFRRLHVYHEFVFSLLGAFFLTYIWRTLLCMITTRVKPWGDKTSYGERQLGHRHRTESDLHFYSRSTRSMPVI
jgi:hypothetical protein